MDKLTFEALRMRMEILTPILTADVLEAMKKEPELAKRYGNGLFEVASQGTVVFRDVLLGAVEFRHPGLLTTEMNWLDRLLEARQINPASIEKFIEVFRTRVASDLPTEQSGPLLKTLNEAMVRFERD